MYSASLLSLEVKVKVWHPTHEWYIPPVRLFLTNLQAVRSCLWAGKNAALAMFHKNNQHKILLRFSTLKSNYVLNKKSW